MARPEAPSLYFLTPAESSMKLFFTHSDLSYWTLYQQKKLTKLTDATLCTVKREREDKKENGNRLI